MQPSFCFFHLLCLKGAEPTFIKFDQKYTPIFPKALDLVPMHIIHQTKPVKTFTTQKDIKFNQHMSEKRGVSLLTLIVTYPVVVLSLQAELLTCRRSFAVPWLRTRDSRGRCRNSHKRWLHSVSTRGHSFMRPWKLFLKDLVEISDLNYISCHISLASLCLHKWKHDRDLPPVVIRYGSYKWHGYGRSYEIHWGQ